MDRYRRRIAMLSVGAQLVCPVRRRIDSEIEIARPVEIVFETTRSRAPTRFFLSRVLQPFVVNLPGTTVYQDMRRMEELYPVDLSSGDHVDIKRDGTDLGLRVSDRRHRGIPLQRVRDRMGPLGLARARARRRS